MHQKTHALLSQSIGTQRELISLHYGTGRVDKKVYLQASLHADEVPAMLVCHHLRGLLDDAEQKGLIQGSIVLVPYANPIGLGQHLLRDHLGRFDLNSGENFNRSYPDFFQLVGQQLEGVLGNDEQQNKIAIRQAIGNALESRPVSSELDSLRKHLLSLSYDADWVLDMHCDFEALMHLYCDTPYLEQVHSLARFIGAETVLFAEGSGGSAFDEAQSGIWYRLRQQFGKDVPIPLAGCGVTVELRGEADVTHELASRDADNLFAWLIHIGVIDGKPETIPEPLYKATPLAGSESLKAPCSGILVFIKELGSDIEAGEVVAELIDPATRRVTEVKASVSGKLFARENRRFAVPGMDIGKVAGASAFRTGPLLGA